LTKEGNSYVFTSPIDGEVVKKFKKAWNKNDDGCLDRIMAEWDQIKKTVNHNLADKIMSTAENDVVESNIEIVEEV